MISEKAYPHIREQALLIEEKASRSGGTTYAKWKEDCDKQALFLDAFAKSFQVKISLKVAGASRMEYAQWRRTSIHFVEMFNSIIEEWHDDIYASAASRARGRLVADSDSESGFQEDAEGNPIYHGSDTKLTSMFLKVMYPEFNEKTELTSNGTLTATTRVIVPKAVAPSPSQSISDADEAEDA